MIGPGIANPMMWSGSDPLDEFAKIERSLRFRAAASARISRSMSLGSRLKWTVSFWVKLGAFTSQAFLSAPVSAGTAEEFIHISASGNLGLSDGTVGLLAQTTASFRDPAAHMHVIFSYDSAQPIAANRGLFIVNGVQQGNSINSIGASRSSYINANLAHVISGYNTIGGGLFDGYLSHFAFVDGKSIQSGDLSAGAFGRTHPTTGQWRPVQKGAIRSAVAAGGGARNGWGVNGFFLTFDNPASLTAIGYDRSQSDTDVAGNNFTATNISLTAGKTYDSLLDTPTNNFNTLNMLSRAASETIVAVDGGITLTNSGTNYATLLSTMGMTKGKWYCEGVITTNTSIVNSRTGGGLATARENLTTYLGSTNQGWGYYSIGSIFHNNGYVASLPALAENDVFMIAFDADAGHLWFGKNGVWANSGDPSTGANPMFTGLTNGPYFFAGWSYTTSDETVFNFGQRPFAYTPPTDFKSLCTKNLPVRQPVMRGDSAFVAVTDSGSSVAISLAAKAPWSDWIRIYKRRDAVEGWRWQFSDDQGNYLDSAGTAAKAPMPALPGTSYIGYALKLSAANGIASGRLTHVNGAADVVADGLATARKMVMLRSEAGGDWFVYHPDLTAGRLVKLSSSAAEAVDSSITGVNSSSFTVAATLATGTYRWISFAETSGFLRLSSYVGNSSNDGPYVSFASTPMFLLVKRLDAANPWVVRDSARNPQNVTDSAVWANLNSAEVFDSWNFFFNSGGIKLNADAAEVNASGGRYITLSIAPYAFRYANAR